MSTGLECSFFEPEPGRWYYLLENWDAPKMSWDWREYATCYGPFADEEAAHQHLRDNHSNPGGSSSQAYHEGYTSDEVEQRLIKEAIKPEPPRRITYRSFGGRLY